MHLRMTGNLLVVRAEDDTGGRPHLRARAQCSTRATACCSSTCAASARAIVLLGCDALEQYFASRLGVEPLSPDFTAEALRALARGRNAPVKAFLLSQERIAGVGNIYADEALFRAYIHPLPPGREAEARADRGAARRGGGVARGRHRRARREHRRLPPSGRREGSFQDRFLVHLREGEPCIRCGTTIKKMRAAGRGTYVCETCQPRPRVPRAGRVSHTR